MKKDELRDLLRHFFTEPIEGESTEMDPPPYVTIAAALCGIQEALIRIADALEGKKHPRRKKRK